MYIASRGLEMTGQRMAILQVPSTDKHLRRSSCHAGGHSCYTVGTHMWVDAEVDPLNL